MLPSSLKSLTLKAHLTSLADMLRMETAKASWKGYPCTLSTRRVRDDPGAAPVLTGVSDFTLILNLNGGSLGFDGFGKVQKIDG